MSEPSIPAKSLVSKLAEVMSAVERVPKRGRNDFHKYDYATEADIAATVRAALSERHVMLIPSIVGESRHPVGEKGSTLTVLEMEMEFIDGDSGESIKKLWRGYGTDKEDKGGYKAMTGGEKYFLLKTFLMPTGDDPERNEQEKKLSGYTVQRPIDTGTQDGPPVQVTGTGGHSVTTNNYATTANTAPAHGGLRIEKVSSSPTKNKNVTKYFIVMSTGEEFTTIKTKLAGLCEQLAQENAVVTVQTEKTKWGTELVEAHRVGNGASSLPVIDVNADLKASAHPITADDIPFRSARTGSV